MSTFENVTAGTGVMDEFADSPVVGGWAVGLFHHDPCDDSLYWVERWQDGGDRLVCTGSGRVGLFIGGCRALSDDHRFDADPVVARSSYVQVLNGLASIIGMSVRDSGGGA
jgi:hypothetical protein